MKSFGVVVAGESKYVNALLLNEIENLSFFIGKI